MTPSGCEIREADTPDINSVRELFREYAELVGNAICFESFQRELAELPGRYAAPAGRLFIAVFEGRLAGCVALRPLPANACEMKRLYVREEFRGSGLGRSLVDRILQQARAAGYRVLRLDTLPQMTRAIRMYRTLGFHEIPPYGDNPAEALCFELPLSAEADRSPPG